MNRRDTNGYEIYLNNRYRGLYRRESAMKKLKQLMGRRKWSSALFPGRTKYSTSNGDVIVMNNVGCYRCARADRRKKNTS